jgi:hypothetical protein
LGGQPVGDGGGGLFNNQAATTMSATIGTQITTAQARPARDSRLWLRPRGLALLFLAWMIVRWLFSTYRQLVPDEAYYWVWSRHLSLSYVDHPPMIAWLIRLGTDLLGPGELGVRCLMTILTAGTILIMTMAARRLIDDWRAVAFVPVALLLCPLMNAIGSLATPDTPACFFQAAALACALAIFAPNTHGKRGPLWLGFGLFIGLALLSKYTSVLLGLAIFLALLWTPQGRRHLRTPWPWLGAAIAVAIFSPVILWNAQHHWISFKFQLRHGLSAGDIPPWSSVLAYLGGQFAVSTPILFFLLVFVLWIYSRRRDNPMHVRILLLSTATPLLFFAFSALHHRPEANWPMFAYLPGTLLIAHYFGEHWTRRREAWARLAAIVALIGTIFIHSPEVGWTLFPRFHMPPWDQQFGWRELAAKVDSLRDGAPVYSVDYAYASELSFYLRGRPEVWPLPGSDRPTAFDEIPGYPPVADFDRVILVRKQLAGVPATVDWRLKENKSHFELIPFDATELGHMVHRNLITVASR